MLDDPSIIGATGCAARRHHAPHREDLNFKRCAEQKGWKQAVEERDQGSFDWITYEVAIGFQAARAPYS